MLIESLSAVHSSTTDQLRRKTELASRRSDDADYESQSRWQAAYDNCQWQVSLLCQGTRPPQPLLSHHDVHAVVTATFHQQHRLVRCSFTPAAETVIQLRAFSLRYDARYADLIAAFTNVVLYGIHATLYSGWCNLYLRQIQYIGLLRSYHSSFLNSD